MPIGSGSVLIDAGANAECTPEFLLQFGCMGSLYARKALHKPQPRVALLNNGAEDSKGDGLHKEAYRLLQEAAGRGLLHFTGNIEARDVLNDKADVIVADGFSGNILLKAVEGTAQYMGRQIKGIFLRSPASKLGYLFCRRGVKACRSRWTIARSAARCSSALRSLSSRRTARRTPWRSAARSVRRWMR